MRDPRSHSRYSRARRLYLAGYAGQPAQCALCGRPIDTTLPGTHPWGPTVEHRIPIRRMRAMVQTWDELLALACDTSLWSVAHQRCQSRQGGRSSKERVLPQPPPRRNSRQW